MGDDDDERLSEDGFQRLRDLFANLGDEGLNELVQLVNDEVQQRFYQRYLSKQNEN